MNKVTVTTIKPLDAVLKKKTEAFIAKKTKGKAEIEYVVDSSILGGIIIQIGDVSYDGSIKRQMDKLKQNF